MRNKISSLLLVLALGFGTATPRRQGEGNQRPSFLREESSGEALVRFLTRWKLLEPRTEVGRSSRSRGSGGRRSLLLHASAQRAPIPDGASGARRHRIDDLGHRNV